MESGEDRLPSISEGGRPTHPPTHPAVGYLRTHPPTPRAMRQVASQVVGYIAQRSVMAGGPDHLGSELGGPATDPPADLLTRRS